MRIGICVRTWGEQGGIGYYTRNIVTEMLRLDHATEFVLFYADRSFLGTFRDHENVREIYVPGLRVVRGPGKLFWDQAAIPWLAHAVNVDVIFHTKFAIPLLTRRKTAMVLHGTERFYYPQFHRKGDLLYFRTIYPLYFKRASMILAVSERARQDIIDVLNVDPDKVKTIHLAAEPIFRVVDDEVYLRRIRVKYRLPRRFILHVGGLYPGKNVGRLLKALAQVRRRHDVSIVLAGFTRWRAREDLDLVPELGLEDAVHPVGYVPHADLVGLYNLASATVFPSFYESFGLVVIEANACGCPVVTSRTGGTPESAGDAALYVDPLDVDGLAAAILRVLEDAELRSDLIGKGFRNVRRFSWEKTARETLEALKGLVPAGTEVGARGI